MCCEGHGVVCFHLVPLCDKSNFHSAAWRQLVTERAGPPLLCRLLHAPTPGLGEVKVRADSFFQVTVLVQHTLHLLLANCKALAAASRVRLEAVMFGHHHFEPSYEGWPKTLWMHRNRLKWGTGLAAHKLVDTGSRQAGQPTMPMNQPNRQLGSSMRIEKGCGRFPKASEPPKNLTIETISNIYQTYLVPRTWTQPLWGRLLHKEGEGGNGCLHKPVFRAFSVKLSQIHRW